MLGEVNRRFNVSPNVDALLEALERADLEEEVVRARAKKEEEARLAQSLLPESEVRAIFSCLLRRGLPSLWRPRNNVIRIHADPSAHSCSPRRQR